MKKLFAFLLAAAALFAVSCNKEGTEVPTAGDAVPATQASIVGHWYNPNNLGYFQEGQQPDFDFKADGSVTGDYNGTWSFASNGVLCINFKDWENKDQVAYVLAYTMYGNTVLIMRFDVPDITPLGEPSWDNGKGYVEFFYKDGTCLANNKADIQGKWENSDTYDYQDPETGETVTETYINCKLTFNGDQFELFIAPWNETYKGTYTYSNGVVKFHATWFSGWSGVQPVSESSLQSEFEFPFLGNGDEAYGYIVEAHGAWQKVK